MKRSTKGSPGNRPLLRQHAARKEGILPRRVENWNPITIICWLVGFGIGEVSSIYAIGIPGLNSLILAGLLYWVVMVVAARVKGVQNITFKETDEVL